MIDFQKGMRLLSKSVKGCGIRGSDNSVCTEVCTRHIRAVSTLLVDDASTIADMKEDIVILYYITPKFCPKVI